MSFALLAGCGGGGKPAPAAGAATTTTAATDTAAQVASRVAEFAPRFGQLTDTALKLVNASAFGCDITCRVEVPPLVDAFGGSASALASSLRGATPPAELQDLVASTINAAVALAADADRVKTSAPGGCLASVATTCVSATTSFATDAEALTSALNGWKPYGV